VTEVFGLTDKDNCGVQTKCERTGAASRCSRRLL